MQPNPPPGPPAQPDLPLDYAPALEPVMRQIWESRWRRWHPCPTYEAAVADPFTRRLLCLAAQHKPDLPTPRRVRRAKP